MCAGKQVRRRMVPSGSCLAGGGQTSAVYAYSGNAQGSHCRIDSHALHYACLPAHRCTCVTGRRSADDVNALRRIVGFGNSRTYTPKMPVVQRCQPALSAAAGQNIQSCPARSAGREPAGAGCGWQCVRRDGIIMLQSTCRNAAEPGPYSVRAAAREGTRRRP